MELIDFPELFHKFPWGVVAFDESLRTLKDAIRGRVDMFREMAKRNRTKRISYQLYGFSHAFQVWILEIWNATNVFYTRINRDIIPRMLRWKFLKVVTLFEI